MQIEKILNNNVVITKDDQDNEVIVMGCGLAFKKKIGDRIEKSLIDKVYRLSNDELSQKFQELLQDLPLEYLSLADEIIEYSKSVLDKDLSEAIYISLTDHIRTAIERVENGIKIRNVLLWDIKRFFPKEYKIGIKAIEKIDKEYHVDLPEDEAGFIALHLVNAQTENDEMNDMYDLTKTMQDIMNIVKYFFKTTFDEESVYFYRFTTHLRFFIARMMAHSTHEGETDEELLEIVKMKYHNAYQCVLRIADFLEENYAYQMSSDESLYLTIHIARLVQKNS
ncbi:beta-glucoside operon transcriptional antiterminator [Enterococcus sp. PF1-24]|uniref:BglG family transcription antiterminator LicT n=1 Tax=unclassified Enterococcus TaxID=2608891 RepID=UPI002475EAC4|nr:MULTISPECIES: PRD domain-containing protein [unclassified Enterococcus]MDH6363660.1 beta-glucoside operon transcriptional antiterminator [Enterococcus sp. PFB1-1]MDH6400895.1 beta-glucoside operon transcriptional antiterminator [Enterococcus sp. PF1-24]